MPATSEVWWETTALEDMTEQQWESLCDGCGRCCLVKIRHKGAIRHCRVACRLLDKQSGRCGDYGNRLARVSDCIKLTPDNCRNEWLPDTCAYRLIAEGNPLHDWHHLISGSTDTVHEAGISVAGRISMSEDTVSPMRLHLLLLDDVK